MINSHVNGRNLCNDASQLSKENDGNGTEKQYHPEYEPHVDVLQNDEANARQKSSSACGYQTSKQAERFIGSSEKILPTVARLQELQYDLKDIHGGGTNLAIARVFYNGLKLVTGVTFGGRVRHDNDMGYWVMYEDGDFGWYADTELKNMFVKEPLGTEREKKGWFKARRIVLSRKGMRYSLPPNF